MKSRSDNISRSVCWIMCKSHTWIWLKTKAPPPNPPTTMPMAMPLLLGNHLKIEYGWNQILLMEFQSSKYRLWPCQSSLTNLNSLFVCCENRKYMASFVSHWTFNSLSYPISFYLIYILSYICLHLMKLTFRLILIKPKVHYSAFRGLIIFGTVS